MSRVVVAGGAGFLGSHLCERLVARGDEVVCVDDLSTGRRQNVAHLERRGRFRLVVADVAAGLPPEVETGAGTGGGQAGGDEPAGRDVALRAVCHLASPASPPAYLERPLATLAAGSEGTRHLLDLAVRHRARFLLASTSEVYGDPAVHPQPEGYRGNVDPVGPRSVYDEAKRFAEALTMATHRARGADVAIARIFNTYGPRLSEGDGRVVSNFVVQALTGRPLTVYGDGSQTRSLCFVDDQVDGLLALLGSTLTGPVNIGNPDERTVRELAEAVLAATGSASSIEHRPLPADDPTRRCPDISLARRALGWAPRVALADGLARTVDYFASVRGERQLRQAPSVQEA